MSQTADDRGDVSWPSNGNNSVNADFGGLSGSVACGTSARPAVAERVAEFEREYPDLARKRLSETDGQKLRRELTEAEYVDYEVELRNGETVQGSWEAERRGVAWADAFEAFLESHESYRDARLRIGRGREGTPEHEAFEVSLDDAWGAPYAVREYARAKALEREIEREWGEYTTVMLTFTASSLGPGGGHRPPVDHLRSLTDTWTEYTYHTLRNTMRRLGFDSDEWCYWSQGEPHPGGGENTCYGHIHVAVYVKGDVSERDFHGVIDTHVEHCEGARFAAHDYTSADPADRPISVNGNVENLGTYMASYAGEEGGELLERSAEYLAWATLHWATNSQRSRRSQWANRAVAADRCRQRYGSDESDQVHDHGEKLRYASGNGREIECAECGSSWGVLQDETIAGARLREGSESSPTASGTSDAPGGLSMAWPTATEGARVGETVSDRERRERIEAQVARNPGSSVPAVMGGLGLPPPARELVEKAVAGESAPPPPESFERPARWTAEAVLRGRGEDAEEHSVGRAGGPDMVPLNLPQKGGSGLWERPPGARFRCAECRFSTYNPATMKAHIGGCVEAAEVDLGSVVLYDPLDGTPSW